jgi:hypothetical protein
MKAPMTKDRYKIRVTKFFDSWSDNEGKTVEEKAIIFVNRGKDDINWAFNNVKFIHFQKECVYKKEITGATVRNYAKSVKLFCEMAYIPIPWKKITRGLPRGKKVITLMSRLLRHHRSHLLLVCRIVGYQF